MELANEKILQRDDEPVILVVEDDEGIRTVIREALEIEGYRAEAVVDGHEALKRLRKQPLPALILLDLMLPRVTGWEVIEAVRGDSMHEAAQIPIVIASAAGHSAEETAKKVDGYLKKPIELDQLLDLAERFCGPPGNA